MLALLSTQLTARNIRMFGYRGAVSLLPKRVIFAGGPGSGCHGPNCGAPCGPDGCGDTKSKKSGAKEKQASADELLKAKGWSKHTGKSQLSTPKGVKLDKYPTYTHPQYGVLVVGTNNIHHFDKGYTKTSIEMGLPKYLAKLHSTPGQQGPVPVTKVAAPPAKEVPRAVSKIATDWKAKDAAWKTDQPTFTKAAFQPHLGGAHEKAVYLDQHGNKWLFKPAEKGKELVPYGEEAAWKVSRYIDPNAVEVRTVTIGDRHGSIQQMVPAVEATKLSTNMSGLSHKDIVQLQQQQVVDWFISNHDAHPGQFLKTESGKVIAIDKGQAYKYMPYNDQLSVEYHPNAKFGEQPPIYNALGKAVKAGTITVDEKAIDSWVQRAQSITDAELKDSLQDYLKARWTGQESKQTALLNQAIQRRDNLKADFEKYYANLTKKVVVKEEVPIIREGVHEKALGADAETKKAVSEALAKYTDKDMHYSGQKLDDWNSAYDKLKQEFVANNKSEPKEITRLAMLNIAAEGKGAYAEAAAQIGFTPKDVSGMIGKIKNWTGHATTELKALMQSVVDECCPSKDAKLFAFEHMMTVEKLRKLYPEGHVELYRGIHLQSLSTMGHGEHGELATTGAESWSQKQSIGFGSSVKLNAKVPVEYVITSFKTNPEAFTAHFSEQEFIVAVPGKKAKFKAVTKKLGAVAAAKKQKWVIDLGTPENKDWLHRQRGKQKLDAKPIAEVSIVLE